MKYTNEFNVCLALQKTNEHCNKSPYLVKWEKAAQEFSSVKPILDRLRWTMENP